ncbi:MAG TPA: SAM-dependent methyltransferase [Candidatus Nanoarchaeia archaeon]|nr:SAM-dependent methyltransferase [Candidatus Nanoarchaeia archaeon]
MGNIKYVIEHMEPELFEWCLIEYKNISRIVGREHLIFTSVKNDARKLKQFGAVCNEPVAQLHLQNACILDPAASKTLSSHDQFEFLIFGGILGDFPPKARTKELSSKLNYPARNLGKKQFSTDTAVYVAREIMHGKMLKDFAFQDGIKIKLNNVETVELPFTYVLIDGNPLIPPGLVRHLRQRREF